jgi:hypothetical protein
MDKDGFGLMSFSDKYEDSSRYVPIRELIEKQRAEAVKILSQVVEELEQEEEAHKAAFRAKKVQNCFNLVLYAFEKIFEEFRGDQEFILAPWGASELQSSLDRFAKMLEERGLGTKSNDEIKYLYDEINYPLGELQKFIVGNTSDVPSRKAAHVFAGALNGYFLRLMGIGGEIDDEYSKPGDSTQNGENDGP